MQAHPDVAEALERLGELAAVRRPDDEALGQFLALYYSELPEDDVDDRRIDDIYFVGVAHFDLGRIRTVGSPLVRVMSPDRERDGWSTPHSVVLMVTDDMPFLVDTMRMRLERHGLDIHLLVHPMLLVAARRRCRDGPGRPVRRSARRDGRRLVAPSRPGRRSRSIASTTRWPRRWNVNWRRPSPKCAAWSATSTGCVTGSGAWSMCIRRSSGSPRDSSCSSAPSTRAATSRGTSRRSPGPASASSPMPIRRRSLPSRSRRRVTGRNGRR